MPSAGPEPTDGSMEAPRADGAGADGAGADGAGALDFDHHEKISQKIKNLSWIQQIFHYFSLSNCEKHTDILFRNETI